MKVEKVIGHGKTSESHSATVGTVLWNGCCGQSTIPKNNLPPSTPVKVVAEVEVEPVLKRPEDAVWVRDLTNRGTKLLVDGDLVASVWKRGDCWKWRCRSSSGCDFTNPNAATIECEEHMASLDIFGFSWVYPEEPKCDSYRTWSEMLTARSKS